MSEGTETSSDVGPGNLKVWRKLCWWFRGWYSSLWVSAEPTPAYDHIWNTAPPAALCPRALGCRAALLLDFSWKTPIQEEFSLDQGSWWKLAESQQRLCSFAWASRRIRSDPLLVKLSVTLAGLQLQTSMAPALLSEWETGAELQKRALALLEPANEGGFCAMRLSCFLTDEEPLKKAAHVGTCEIAPKETHSIITFHHSLILEG